MAHKFYSYNYFIIIYVHVFSSTVCVKHSLKQY